jgi:plasmid stability protein
MPSLTIKGVPHELLDRLRQRAEQHRRSLNGEVLHLLEHSVSSTPLPPLARLSRIHRLQQRAPVPPLTDETVQKAIDENRP